MRFFIFYKKRVLQTYPLKMNFVLKIQTDRKRNLETLTSALLPFLR
jgi:hypothetical protein